MAHSEILQHVNGILRVSEDKSASIISDYGDYSVSLPMTPAVLDQMNGQPVKFALCSIQDGGFLVNNVEFIDPPKSRPTSATPTQRHPQPLPCANEAPQNDGSSISDIPDELICSVCQEVLKDPVVTKCDHLFCRACITQWIKSQSVCPMDRKPVRLNDLKSPPRYLTNILDNLKVRCDHHELGCKVVVPLANLETHLKECLFGSIGQRPDDHISETNDQIPMSVEESSSYMHQRHEQMIIDLPVMTPQLSFQRYDDSPMLWRSVQRPSLSTNQSSGGDSDEVINSSITAANNRHNLLYDYVNEQWSSEELSERSTDSLHINFQCNHAIVSEADESIDDLSDGREIYPITSSIVGPLTLSPSFDHDLSLDSMSLDMNPSWLRRREMSRSSNLYCDLPFIRVERKKKKKRFSKHACTLL